MARGSPLRVQVDRGENNRRLPRWYVLAFITASLLFLSDLSPDYQARGSTARGSTVRIALVSFRDTRPPAIGSKQTSDAKVCRLKQSAPEPPGAFERFIGKTFERRTCDSHECSQGTRVRLPFSAVLNAGATEGDRDLAAAHRNNISLIQ